MHYQAPSWPLVFLCHWPGRIECCNHFWQISQEFKTGQIVQGTIIVMLGAYLLRFLAVAFSSIDSGMQNIKPNLDEASILQGVKGRMLLKRVYVPLLQKSTLTAMVLVLVDVIKEMPITLMTRPFGWDTLAVKIYELTSEGEWERARNAWYLPDTSGNYPGVPAHS